MVVKTCLAYCMHHVSIEAKGLLNFVLLNGSSLPMARGRGAISRWPQLAPLWCSYVPSVRVLEEQRWEVGGSSQCCNDVQMHHHPMHPSHLAVVIVLNYDTAVLHIILSYLLCFESTSVAVTIKSRCITSEHANASASTPRWGLRNGRV